MLKVKKVVSDPTLSVYLGLGSNIDRQRYIAAGLDALSQCLGPLTTSSVYVSEAYGFEGDPFYNLVVGLETRLSIRDLLAQIKYIEFWVAGKSVGAKYRARKLDVDLLLYGQEVQDYGSGIVPRADVVKHEYILRPLAEIAPEEVHPVLGQKYNKLLDQLFPVSRISRVQFMGHETGEGNVSVGCCA